MESNVVPAVGVVLIVVGLLWGVFGSFSKHGGGGFGWAIAGIGLAAIVGS